VTSSCRGLSPRLRTVICTEAGQEWGNLHGKGSLFLTTSSSACLPPPTGYGGNSLRCLRSARCEPGTRYAGALQTEALASVPPGATRLARVEAVRPPTPVRLTSSQHCAMALRIVVIDAWTWGSTTRPQYDVSPRFYAAFPLPCGVARFLPREDTAPPEPAGVCRDPGGSLLVVPRARAACPQRRERTSPVRSRVCASAGDGHGLAVPLTVPRLSTLDTSCSADFPFPCCEMEGKQNPLCFSLYAVS
jgi:hypothetical protein